MKTGTEAKLSVNDARINTLFNINIEEMDFLRWKEKSWRGVNIVLERKTL